MLFPSIPDAMSEVVVTVTLEGYIAHMGVQHLLQIRSMWTLSSRFVIYFTVPSNGNDNHQFSIRQNIPVVDLTQSPVNNIKQSFSPQECSDEVRKQNIKNYLVKSLCAVDQFKQKLRWLKYLKAFTCWCFCTFNLWTVFVDYSSECLTKQNFTSVKKCSAV